MSELPRVPLRAQVEALRPYVAGRACVVVGSAPLATPAAVVGPNEIRIAVNGAIASLPDRRADVWVLNSKAQDRPGSPDLHKMHKIMLEQARSASTDHLLLLRGPKVASEDETRKALFQRGATWNSWSLLDKPTKAWMEAETCGRVDDLRPCSSGILAVACVLWCDAASVRLVGFSFKPGYHYLPKDTRPPGWWRNHVPADKQAIAALRARYGPRLTGALVEGVAA